MHSQFKSNYIMKKPNSICEFAAERSNFLLQNFRESIARQSIISIKKAFNDAAEAPAPRFWVSEVRATKVILQLLKGHDATDGMLPKKREMFLEIFRRVKKLHEANPATPVGDLVFEVVNSEAPSSYLTLHHAGRLIRKLRTKSRKPDMKT